MYDSNYGWIVLAGSLALFETRATHEVTHPAEQIEHSVAYVRVDGLQKWRVFEHLVVILDSARRRRRRRVVGDLAASGALFRHSRLLAVVDDIALELVSQDHAAAVAAAAVDGERCCWREWRRGRRVGGRLVIASGTAVAQVGLVLLVFAIQEARLLPY